jgi:hypothetical protein
MPLVEEKSVQHITHDNSSCLSKLDDFPEYRKLVPVQTNHMEASLLNSPLSQRFLALFFCLVHAY